jgi:hypothetical protein
MNSDSTDLKYHHGYPGRHRRGIVAGLSWAVGCSAPFLLLAGAGALFHGLNFLYDKSFPSALGFLVCAGFLVFFLCGLAAGVVDSFKARIVPYFRQHLGDIDTFSGGAALARNCRRLDQLAGELHLTPLSAFGFNDDLLREQVVWHDPGLGLETVAGLLAKVREQPDAVADARAVAADLEKVAAALRQAREKGVSFCLILRAGMDRFISPMEMDARQGKFW